MRDVLTRQLRHRQSAKPIAICSSARGRLILLLGAILLGNLGAWLWALLEFGDQPAMLAIALVVFGLGLRHALDADHIAAIDNVTRKFMQEGRKPIAVGFFFALGHSSIVCLMTALVAYLTISLDRFDAYRELGGTISLLISVMFFICVAAMNMSILRSLFQSLSSLRRDRTAVGQQQGEICTGLLIRLLRPVFGLITRSWHMFPLGFLFGLGFDTATEVALFGVSAAQIAHGFSFAQVLVIPALFAAGMSLVDTLDGVAMLGVYGWAAENPRRKIGYNAVISAVSLVVSVLIGGAGLSGLLQGFTPLPTILTRLVGDVGSSINGIGIAMVSTLLAAWFVSRILLGRRSAAEPSRALD